LLEDELLETRQGLSNSGVSWTTNENKHQISVEIPVPVNFDKNNTTSNNKKYDYEKLYNDNIPSNNKKRSYEELFGDMSDFLDTNVPGNRLITN